MSRSNQTDIVNPAVRWFSWNGDTGGFYYWDKEQKKRIPIPLPFRFMVLDTLSTIKGYNKALDYGYYSNEIRDIKKEILTVRSKSGIMAKGLYEEVKAECDGAKYCQSVYAAIKEGDKFALCNIAFVGCAVGAWIEFRKKVKKIYDGAVSVDEMLAGKTGKIEYQSPIFKMIEVSPEAETAATALDKELQEYLTAYFKRNNEAVADAHVEDKIAGRGAIQTNPEDPLRVGEPPPEVDEDSSGLPF